MQSTQNHSQSYKINSQRVVSETIANETIVINLETGTYYSLNESGSFIWGNMEESKESPTKESSINLGHIMHICSLRYGVSEKEIEMAVRSFIDNLLAEKLIVPVDAEIVAPLDTKPSTQDVEVTQVSQNHPIFTPPTIEIYRDMQEMLLADPIHDVDETGWPKLK
ncbi:MAG: PqqD family protein [Candidatus Pacebacteria bacterium]|nr:PqqD family protein [Candidatus Paceibacterota bacterium]